MAMTARRPRAADLLAAIGFTAVAAALVWPGPWLLAGRIEPRVFGLPLAWAWSIGWLVVAFGVLLLHDLFGRGGG